MRREFHVIPKTRAVVCPARHWLTHLPLVTQLAAAFPTRRNLPNPPPVTPPVPGCPHTPLVTPPTARGPTRRWLLHPPMVTQSAAVPRPPLVTPPAAGYPTRRWLPHPLPVTVKYNSKVSL